MKSIPLVAFPPLTVYGTVTIWPEAAANATVSLGAATDSLPVEAVVEKLTLGGASSSRIVTLMTLLASVALLGAESVIRMVSSASSRVSLTIGNRTVFTVSLALNVTIPLVNVKSAPPPVAVPPVTAYLTVTTWGDGVARAT